MSKVYEITFCIAARNKFNPNVVKANISKLLNMGKTSKVISSKLTPLPPTNAIAVYIAGHTDLRFFNGEFIILTREDKFVDGTTITCPSLQKRMSDVIPMLNDKKTGEPLNLDVIDIRCKKL